MSRVRSLRNRGEVESHGDAAPRLAAAGDYVLVRRGALRSIVMKCPDDCGEMLTVNLDPRSGRAWRIDERAGKVTLYPSVWRQQGCEAHFIIWRDAILWCDIGSDDWVALDEQVLVGVAEGLGKANGKFIHYEDIAEAASLHPWEALWAAQRLESRGVARCRDHVYFAATDRASRWRRLWR